MFFYNKKLFLFLNDFYFMYKLLLWSIVFIFSTELSEIDCCMAEGTEMNTSFLDLVFIHFVFTAFASIVVSCHDRFSTYYASWEVSSTLSAACVILTYVLFAISSRTFYLLARSLFRRMFGEDTYSHIDIFLSLLSSTHSLQLNECSWTLFITLNIIIENTLL